METTYRLIDLEERSPCGLTAASPELARLVPTNEAERSRRIGLERTDWVEQYDKLKVHRTVLVDAESAPGEWVLGV
jgi:hypothetical protein